MEIYEFEGKRPKISPDVAFISNSAKIIGDVEIAEGCSIFENVILEGVKCSIRIGANSNIQSGTIIHGMYNEITSIGEYVTIGHKSLIHGGTLEDFVTIGIGSIIMGYAKIGKGSIVAAGSLITMNKTFPPLSLIVGHPAEFINKLDDSNVEEAKRIAELYVNEGKIMKNTLKKINLQ